MFHRGRERKALVLAIAALSLQQTATAQDSEVEEISVTGSRIRNVGFESPVPVTSLNTEELTQFEPGLGISQQLESLPQYFNNVSSDNIANRVSADVGQSQLNMRGMGGNRTLVLLDGARIVPSDRRSSVSVDYLPSTLMRRVDVVTGGASAAYGADALAGVTNFILDREFTGLKTQFRAGINEEGDGEFTRGSVTFGRDFGATGDLHVFGTVEARVNDGYRRGSYDDQDSAGWDEDEGYVLNPEWSAWRAANPTAPASAAPVPLRLTARNVYSSNFSPTGLITAPGSALNRMHFTTDGNGVQPFYEGGFASFAGAGNQNTQVGAPGDPQYELWRRNHYQALERVGVEQQTMFLGSDWQLTDNFKLWGHALWGRTRNTVEANSSGGSGTGLGHAGLAYMTIFQDNAFLPESVRETMIAENRQSIRVDQHGYLNSDWGFREQPTIVNRIGSVTLGFDMETGISDWTLRGLYQTGEARKTNVNQNWERLDRFYLAVDAIDDPDNPGEIICRIQYVQRQLAAQGRNLEAELGQWAQANTRVFPTDNLALDPSVPLPIAYPIAVDSIDNTISGCVPVNMFGEGNQSDAAMDYIFSSRHKTGKSTQEMDFAELLASGTIHEGWGAGPITGAVGLNWRDSSIEQIITDPAINELGPIYNVTLTDGTDAIRGISPSLHGSSTNLHRFSDQPTFAGGYDVRELFAETNVPVFELAGGQRADVNLAARWADYSRAGEFVVWKAGLSVQATEGLRLRATQSHDIREGSFEELFVQQGRGVDVDDPWNGNIRYNTFNLTGGNPDLEAEEADTTVLGFVYSPAFLEGLQFSVDRYVVDLSSAIGTFSEQQIIDQCFADGVLCDRVIRGTDGRISRVITSFVNINAAKVAGYDLEVSYRWEPDFFGEQAENLSVRLFGGYMEENSTTPLNGSKLDQAGSGNPFNFLPKGTANLIVNYQVGDWGFNVQQNWMSSTKRNVQWVEGVDVDSNRVPSINLTNLAVFWTKELGSGVLRSSFNVQNLFDRDPVIAGSTVVGDEIGRRYALGFDYSFE